MIRVRIAPSPTGFAHIGTAYTALFNYAFAKKNKGKFVIRVEDTDVKRNVKGAEEAIFEGLSWLSIPHNESVKKPGKYGPYRQSDKIEVYEKKARELVKKGLAYEDDGAIRFKNPGKDVFWKDLIKGQINFSGDEITDFVILKSDGYPTYNFAVVIDDLDMKITHVIRGEDHVSNTPRQIAIYKAFEEKSPFFAHHPTLRNKEHKKLSKRKDKVNIMTFKEEGYLPEALVNFLCLLGWSHPDEKEVFGLSEFVELFSLERVRKAGPIFDTKKLDWMNGEYIRKTNNEKLIIKIDEFYKEEYPKEKLKRVLPLVKDRINKLTEFKRLAGPIFETPSKPIEKMFRKDFKTHISTVTIALEGLSDSDWEQPKIDEAILSVVDKNKFNKSDFFMNLRVSQFSSNVTPPVNESIKIIGKEETIKRLKSVLK